jgi:hypothetical protein
MNVENMLDSVRNDLIQFVTLRPPNSPFASLERQVVVTGPPELVSLSQTPQIDVLNALVRMLRDPSRNWGAMVILAAMTRREEKTVDVFATSPDEWQKSIGKDAYDRWNGWLEIVRARLTWDSETGTFIETPGREC